MIDAIGTDAIVAATRAAAPQLGDLPATSVDELHKLLTQLPVGIPASVELLRDGRRLQRMVIPADYPVPTGSE